MKPNNNHRWNRCIIDEVYCLSFGHDERFFRAFDKAYNLKPITTTQGGQSIKSEQQCVPARLQSSGIKRCADGANDAMVKAEHVNLKSALYTHDIVAEVGKHLPSGAQKKLLGWTVSEECSGSNPDGSVPARFFWYDVSLQDIGGQYFSEPPTPPLPAEQKHAGVFSRYVTNFQSRVFPPTCNLLYSSNHYNHFRIPSERSDMRMQTAG